MKKLIWIILLLGPGLMSYAQQDTMRKKTMYNRDSMMMRKDGMMHDKDGMMRMHEPNYDRLKADLGLTDKQVADWKKMEMSMKPEMEKMHARHIAEMEKMKMQKNARLKTILTKEQYDRYLKSRPMDDDMRMPNKDHEGPPPVPEN